MYELIKTTHPEWHDILKTALDRVDQSYLQSLVQTNGWLPGLPNLFAAFSLPLSRMRFLLLGESPYPRAQSANGYAFWDNAVGPLWSPTGLSKEVNRATSLRNFLKMLLLARGDLHSDLSQDAIAALDKSCFCQTGEALFRSLINKGFLLLNASLVYREKEVNYHAKQWRPFIQSLFEQLAVQRSSLQVLLFGQIASKVPESHDFNGLKAEHPYNVSFITNPEVLHFFKPLDLLKPHVE